MNARDRVSGPRAAVSAVSWAGLVALDTAALARLEPDWHGLRVGLAAPGHWLESAGTSAALADVARAALWLGAAWLALALLAATLPLLPGLPGRVGSRIAAAVAPALLRRLVAGTLGLGVLVAPAAALAAPAPTTGATVAPSCQLLPAPALPASTTMPADTPAPPAPTELPAAPSRPSDAAARHVVVPGESLWSITRDTLAARAAAAGADVAHEWPRWFAANRATIGDDPALIRPGQELLAPPDGQR